MAFPYLEIVVGSQIVIACFELYLDWRQRRCFKAGSPQPELAKVIPIDKFLQAQKYGLSKANLGMIESIIMTAVHIGGLVFFLYPYMWGNTVRVLNWLRIFAILGRAPFTDDDELARTLAFLTLTQLLDLILGLPGSIYKTFVIEERFGFNRTTVRTFVTDLLLSIVLAVAIGFPVASLLWWVMDKFSGPLMWLNLYAAVSIVILVFTFIVPNFIMPLFNKFTPLEEGRLRSSIEDLAREMKFPLKKIYVMDGSKRSSHSNAFFFGIFTKFIALFDTLIEQNKGAEERIVAVTCHELGHWSCGHSIKGLMMVLSKCFVLFGLFGLTSGNINLFRSFGFTKGTPHLIGLILFSELYSPVAALLSPLDNWNTRRWEYQADNFAKKLGYQKELAEGLVVLHIKSLANMNPDPLYSLYHYTHPTLVERLRALGVKPDAVKVGKTE